MTDFTGTKCPVCGKPFTKADDVVVCPECGAPYHRSCYQKAGHCVYADRHGKPDAWPGAGQGRQAAAADATRCPRCGHDNHPDALFCEHCGASLSANEQNVYTRRAQAQQGAPQQNGPAPGNFGPFGPGAAPFMFDPMAGVNPDEEVGGVKAGDIARVVQSNTGYYLPVFMRYEKQHRSRFNFAAFLLSGAWLLYRKQYKLGSLITALMLAMQVAAQLIMFRFTSPALLRVMDQMGISSQGALEQNQLYSLTAELMRSLDSWETFVYLLLPFLLMYVLPLVCMFVLGFTGNRLYRSHCIKVARAISREPGADLLLRYQEKGGVNLFLPMLLMAAYFILSSTNLFL